MQKIILFASLFTFLVAENKAFSQDMVEIYEFGIGSRSCAFWLSSPHIENEGNVWILGFLTGLNYFSNESKTVGRSTDASGIVGAVKLRCKQHPEDRVADTTLAVYKRLRAAGK